MKSNWILFVLVFFTNGAFEYVASADSLASSAVLELLLERLIKDTDDLVERVDAMQGRHDSLEQRLDKQAGQISKHTRNNDINELAKTVGALKQEITGQSNRISEMESKPSTGLIGDLMTKFDGMQEQLDKQTDEIANLKLKLQTNEQANVELVKKVVTLQQRLNIYRHGISDLKRQLLSSEETCTGKIEDIRSQVHRYNDTQSVSFYARVSPSYTSIAPRTTIKFARVQTNIGNAYDSATGEFTVPLAGVYVFYSHILTKHKHFIETGLQINGVTKLLLYSGGSPYYGSGSNSMVVHLNKGDRVKMVTGCCGSTPFYIHHLWSTFSGFLLTPDK